MKFTKEFKLECVRKHKNGTPIDYPGGCKRVTYYRTVLNWVEMFDALGDFGLEHYLNWLVDFFVVIAENLYTSIYPLEYMLPTLLITASIVISYLLVVV